MLYQDIPRIYTAIAEWGSCLVYLYIIKKENMKSVHFLAGSLFMLAIQSIFLTLTDNVTEILWIPCMMIAAGMMYVFLMIGGKMKPLGAAYCCARAFVLAEFAASLQWQMVSSVQTWENHSIWVEILITIVIFGGCFTLDIYLEKDLLKQNYLEQMTVREVAAVAIMAVAIFAFSNLSFLNENVPFASRERADIFSIRTLIDLGGIAILYAYQSRISEYVAERELSVMNMMLKSQYEQYRNYQDSLDLIQMKYHDLKHQITGLRAESDEEKRKKWIDSMEKEIAAFENISRTGNQVLDTILAAKIFHCRKNHIQITCVADGKLLDYMHVTDICSIFGNALDNAIEHVILIPDPEKRLIHLTVSAQKGFVFIKIENYCEAEISKNEEDLITTTKKDSKNHGFGLKSIRTAAEKHARQAENQAEREKKRTDVEIQRARRKAKSEIDDMKERQFFWDWGYLTVIFFSLLQNGAFQRDVLKFITIPINWCKEYIAWLEQLEYISNTAGEMLFKGFFSTFMIVAGILGSVCLVWAGVEQYKKIWDDLYKMVLISSISFAAVLGNLIRAYLPLNLLLVILLINTGTILLRAYLKKKYC